MTKGKHELNGINPSYIQTIEYVCKTCNATNQVRVPDAHIDWKARCYHGEEALMLSMGSMNDLMREIDLYQGCQMNDVMKKVWKTKIRMIISELRKGKKLKGVD